MLPSGARLGPYEILGALGAGGMGIVYRARDARLRRDVALKVLLPEFATAAQRLARFQREAEMLAALDHPGIVTIFSVEEADGVRFLTMQLVDGETVDRLIDAGGMGIPLLLEIALPLAEALAAAHARGVIHRDLKPSNVMRTREGRLKVLDFGLAWSESGDSAATRSLSGEQIVGTVPYMSPEQLAGKPVDARTDVFSFGTLLYEMATGTRPFQGDSPVATLTAIVSTNPANVCDLRPGLPRELGQLIERCLQKNPSLRISSMVDVAAALRSIPGSLDRSHPSAPASGGLTAPRTPARAASIAVLPFTSLSTDPEDHFFADGTSEEIINALGRLPDVKVAARTSTFSFKGKNEDLRIIGEKLGVTTILEGSVRRAGRRLRITAQLVDVSSGYHIWSERYDRELDDVFDIQEQIARSIASRLSSTLLSGPGGTFVRHGTSDLEAFRLYTQGRTLFDQRTASGMQRAVPYFKDAIRRDEHYAVAWSGLADALVMLGDYQVVAPESVLEDARAAVRRALQLDPSLAEAHASLGVLETLLRNGPAAVAALERAVQLRPGYAHAHNWLSWIQTVLGRKKAALASAQRSVELDPLAPEPLSNLALAETANGFAERGLQTARRGLEIQPDFETSAFYEALALYHLGRAGEAIPILPRTSVSWAPASTISVLGMAHAAVGEHGEARLCLERLTASGEDAGAGLIQAALGDAGAALESLARVRRWEYWGTIAIHNFFDPVLAPLRGEPRFKDIQRAIDASWQVLPSGSGGLT